MLDHGASSVTIDMEYNLENLVWYDIKSTSLVSRYVWADLSFFVARSTVGALDVVEDWRSWGLQL